MALCTIPYFINHRALLYTLGLCGLCLSGLCNIHSISLDEQFLVYNRTIALR